MSNIFCSCVQNTAMLHREGYVGTDSGRHFFREGCNDITCIDLRLLGGYNENISKNAQNELIAALMEFIRCSNRF